MPKMIVLNQKRLLYALNFTLSIYNKNIKYRHPVQVIGHIGIKLMRPDLKLIRAQAWTQFKMGSDPGFTPKFSTSGVSDMQAPICILVGT